MVRREFLKRLGFGAALIPLIQLLPQWASALKKGKWYEGKVQHPDWVIEEAYDHVMCHTRLRARTWVGSDEYGLEAYIHDREIQNTVNPMDLLNDTKDRLRFHMNGFFFNKGLGPLKPRPWLQHTDL